MFNETRSYVFYVSLFLYLDYYQYLSPYTVNVGSFSAGILWDYYQETWRGEHIDQSNNPSFVLPKYENLKEEILIIQSGWWFQ